MRDRIDTRTALVALLATAALLGGLTATAAGANNASEPELVITRIQVEQLPGTPPYITLDESAHPPGFVVKVSVRNRGTARSGKSVVLLNLEQKGNAIWHLDQFIDPLPANSPVTTSTFVVDNPPAMDPGFLVPVATVTWALTDTHRRSEIRDGKRIPVVPHDWNISYFHTRLNQGGVGPINDTYGELRLMYRFSRFDEASKEFVWKAHGQVTEKAQFSGGGCSGQKTVKATDNPWPGGAESELRINADLTQYSGSVQTTNEPPVKFTVNCPQSHYSFQYTLPWEDLVTYTGGSAPPSMSPSDTTLEGEGDKQTPAGPVKFLWRFNARLSGI